MLISTTDGEIFGAFCDKKLHPRQATTIVKYTGRRGCFTFRFKPAASSSAASSAGGKGNKASKVGVRVGAVAGDEVEVWRWSGLNEMFFRALKSAGMSGGMEGVGHPAAFVRHLVAS